MTGDRSWIYWDRFMFLQIAREHRLTPAETLVLVTLANRAFFREKTWTGSITELAGEMHATWRSVDRAVGTLITEGLLVEEVSFRRGHAGRVRVVVYDLLIPPDRATRDAGVVDYSRALLLPVEQATVGPNEVEQYRASAGATDADEEPRSRAIPAPLPRHSSESAEATSQNVDPLGIAVRGKGLEGSARATVADGCSVCRADVVWWEGGHGFCDEHHASSQPIGAFPRATAPDNGPPPTDIDSPPEVDPDGDVRDLTLVEIDELAERAFDDDEPLDDWTPEAVGAHDETKA